MSTQTIQTAGSTYSGLKIGNLVLEKPIVSSDERDRLVLDMGRKCSVYLAHRDGVQDIKKAVKIYIPEISRNPTFSKEVREFRIWQLMETRNIDKTHIVDIEDGGIIEGLDERLNGSAYLVMPYMNDGTLWDHSGSMTLEQKVGVFLDISHGIEALHSIEPPIAHGDIHPGQMLHDRSKGWMLSDFGVSAVIEIAHGYTTRSSRRGAVRYRDPVMEREKAITLPNDIYQLGMSMLEILAGISIVDVDTLDSLKKGYQEIPLPLKELMISCIRGDPTKRPDIHGVIGTLQEIIIPSMSPEYRHAITQIVKKLQGISERYLDNKHKFCALSNHDVDELFSAIGTSYDLIQMKGFKTPVAEVETIAADAMERDLQLMAEFLVEHHKDYNKSPTSIGPEMRKAPAFYADAIEAWERNRYVDINFEDEGIYAIGPRRS